MKILPLDLSKTKIAATVWTEIADLMKIEVKNLMDTSHSNFVKKYGTDCKFSNSETIKFLQKDATVLNFPIAIKGKLANEVKTNGAILEFFDFDTAGIKIP